MINKTYVKGGLKIIGFILMNVLIFFTLFIFVIGSGNGEGLFEALFSAIYLILSLPLLIVGFFTPRNISKRVGLAYSLAYITLTLIYVIVP
jgi:hypothetical protein